MWSEHLADEERVAVGNFAATDDHAEHAALEVEGKLADVLPGVDDVIVHHPLLADLQDTLVQQIRQSSLHKFHDMLPSVIFFISNDWHDLQADTTEVA